MSETLDRLTTILQDCFDDEDIVATPELSAADVEDWDSLAHVRLMLMIERAFKVRFIAAKISSFKNIGDLEAAIDAKAASA